MLTGIKIKIINYLLKEKEMKFITRHLYNNKKKNEDQF
jgi:hypothetical protein